MFVGAWRCQWPGCDRLATTQLRTVELPYMKVCRQHRHAWLSVRLGELAVVYRDMQPATREASGVSWLRRALPFRPR